MVVPSIKLNESIVDCDGNAPATTGLPGCTLPPSFYTPSQLLDEPIVAPSDDRIAELRRPKYKRIYN